MILNKTDFEKFKTWLDLDINSIAWEGRYAESFSEFWHSFFKEMCRHFAVLSVILMLEYASLYTLRFSVFQVSENLSILLHFQRIFFRVF